MKALKKSLKKAQNSITVDLHELLNEVEEQHQGLVKTLAENEKKMTELRMRREKLKADYQAYLSTL